MVLEKVQQNEEKKIDRLEKLAAEESMGANESQIENTYQEPQSLSEYVPEEPSILEEKKEEKPFIVKPKLPPSQDVAKPKPNVRKLWELDFDDEGMNSST